MLYDLMRGVYETIRETLPSTTDEAGAFVSGMAWAFVLHWAVLIMVTWQYIATRGAQP